MNLLISGGTGFVGRNLLLEALRDPRYERILVPVRDPAKLRVQLAFENIDTTKIVPLPWSDPVPKGEQIDHVVHGAGVLFARSREEYLRVNVEATRALVSALPTSARLVVISSQSAGGPTPVGSDARTMINPDRPITYYGESKIEMERVVSAIRPDAMILRPPMILGPRDRATLPLFQLASGRIRPKPGLRPKTYSWIAVDDLVTSMLRLVNHVDWSFILNRKFYVAAPMPITDVDLVKKAAALLERRGFLLPLPHPVMAFAAQIVDAIPSLRAAAPSLTRDRVKEIFPDRWVVDAADYRKLVATDFEASLGKTLAATLAWYRRTGEMPTRQC